MHHMLVDYLHILNHPYVIVQNSFPRNMTTFEWLIDYSWVFTTFTSCEKQFSQTPEPTNVVPHTNSPTSHCLEVPTWISLHSNFLQTRPFRESYIEIWNALLMASYLYILVKFLGIFFITCHCTIDVAHRERPSQLLFYCFTLVGYDSLRRNSGED